LTHQARFPKCDNQSALIATFSLHGSDLESKRRIILGQNVIRLRGVRGLTQEKLAELVGVDRRYIQRIEAGTANPGVDVLVRLKLALAVNWTRLLD
jgi:DNA-binding XRE family transcriptional regulator